MPRCLCLALFCLMPLLAVADEVVAICHGYGCLVQEPIRFSELRLREVSSQLRLAVDAENERILLAAVIGRLYGWAGEQSDIRNDRGGNYADAAVPGRMDCIDHSTSTTRLLRVLERRGALRFHRVLEPDVRHFALVFPAHWSAVIEEKAGDSTDNEVRRFVVDSWFVDNGQPAVVLPLEDWKEGAGPDV